MTHYGLLKIWIQMERIISILSELGLILKVYLGLSLNPLHGVLGVIFVWYRPRTFSSKCSILMDRNIYIGLSPCALDCWAAQVWFWEIWSSTLMVFNHFMYVEPKASLLFDLNSNPSLEYEWFMIFFSEVSFSYSNQKVIYSGI